MPCRECSHDSLISLDDAAAILRERPNPFTTMTTDLLPLLDIRNEMSSKTCSIDFPFAAGPISNSNQLGCHGHIANTELARIYAAYAIWHHYRSLDVDLECFRSIVEDLPECVRLRLRINEVSIPYHSPSPTFFLPCGSSQKNVRLTSNPSGWTPIASRSHVEEWKCIARAECGRER